MSVVAFRALETTDAMPAPLRQCVHEFGYAIVHAFIEAGVRDPAQIKRLVHEAWMGARQPIQRNRIGKRHSRVLDNLDWIMISAGAGISAETLLRVLYTHGMIIVPKEPNEPMVDASMDAVNHMGVVSKRTKHLNRLRAANHAAAKRLWPHLFHGGATS